MLFQHIYDDPEVSEELKEEARKTEVEIVEVFMELESLGYPQDKLTCSMTEDEEGPVLLFLCGGQEIPLGVTYEAFLAVQQATQEKENAANPEGT